MSARSELMAASAAGDEVGIERHGWSPVLRALRWWTKPGRVTLEGTVAPLADALGDQDPERIVGALRALLAARLEWRPSAAQILAEIQAPEPLARGRREERWDLTPAALTAVRLAAAAGADICECPVRLPQILISSDGVLTCLTCGGIEYGQYETAMESPSLGETPA